MALILCPECHNQISDKAEQCPYCGLPAKYFLQELSVKQDMTALLKEKCDYKKYRMHWKKRISNMNTQKKTDAGALILCSAA